MKLPEKEGSGPVSAGRLVLKESDGKKELFIEHPENTDENAAKEKPSKIVAGIPEEKTVLYAVEEVGIYEDFTLEVKGMKRFF